MTDEAKSAPAVSPKRAAKLIALLLLVGLGGGAYYNHSVNSPHFESTDNAQIEGDLVSVSSEVAGRITKVHVADNQQVEAGTLLVEIDPTDYQSRTVELEAALEVARQQQAQAFATLELTDRQAQAAILEQSAGVEVAQSSVEDATVGIQAAHQQLLQARASRRSAHANLSRLEANLGISRSELWKTDGDLKRNQMLFAKDEISRQQLELTMAQRQQAAFKVQAGQREIQQAQAQLVQADSVTGQMLEMVRQNQAQTLTATNRVKEAQAKLVNAQTAPSKVAVARAQYRVAVAQVKQARANLIQARDDLKRTKIYAPCAGTVSRRSAQNGGYTSKSGALLGLIVSRKPWVVANFKETQMEFIRPGSLGEVAVDTYPDKVFPVRVESVQAGTGARFSLLPPENASGSFVKVVQRLPVKLVFTEELPETLPLRAGMNVEARVRLK